MARMIRNGKSLSGRERNCCFLNTRAPRFANISAVSGLDFLDDGRAVGHVDWDQDGDLDLWLISRSGPMVRFMRNDTNTDHDFLALRLEGRSSNRDAVGARVQVVLKQPQGAAPLVKTLYAGSGFIGQSSKWLHFGLGAGAEIDRVVVRWPGGDSEEFSQARVGGRYRLVQGSGQVESWPAVGRDLKLAASPVEALEPTGQAQIWLAARAPLPIIGYKDQTGQEQTLEASTGGPLLLNLWASWCKPCLEELQEFSQQEQALRSAGLSLLALSVDGLNNDPSSVEPQDLAALLQRLEFPFEHGLATAENVDKLELLYAELFGRHVALPVPTSFLIDKDGQLAAIYLGPVKVEKILDDIKNLSAGAEQKRRFAIPFAGRWHLPPRPADRREVAGAYVMAGYFEDAIPVLRQVLREEPDNVEGYNLLGASLVRQGDMEGALEQYRQALRIDPNYVLAHYNVGLALLQQEQLTAAEESFRQALQLTPDYFEARIQLALLLETQEKLPEATEQFRDAVRTDPSSFELRRKLARILARQKRHKEAAEQFREALRIDPVHVETYHDFGIVLGRMNDFPQAIQAFRKSLELNSAASKVGGTEDNRLRLNLAAAHVALATSLVEQERHVAAIKNLRAAVELRPDWPVASNNLAQILATCADQQLRDPAAAVRLAQRARRSTENEDPALLETLATAYAAAGRFEQAVETAQRALELAGEKGEQELIDVLNDRLRLFRAGRPYVEGSGAAD